MSLPRNTPPDPVEAQRRGLEDPVLASVVRAADEARDTDCPDAEWLALYAERELATGEMALVQPHLQTCERCQAIVAAYQRASAGAPRDEGQLAPATDWFERRFGGWRWLVPMATAAAVAVVAVAVLRGPGGSRVAESPGDANRFGGPRAEAPATPVAAPSAPAPADSALAGRLARADATPPPIPAARPSARREADADLRDRAAAKSAVVPRDEARVAEAVPPPPPAPFAPPAPPAPAAPATSAATAAPTPAELALGAARAKAAPAAAPAVADARAAAAGGAAAPERAAANSVASSSATFRAEVAIAPPWRLRSGGVERSRDRGTTWQPVPTPTGVRVTAIAAVSPAVCWAIGDDVVLRSVDGATWARTTRPSGERLTSIAATSASDGSVTTATGARLVTTDGGATWRQR